MVLTVGNIFDLDCIRLSQNHIPKQHQGALNIDSCLLLVHINKTYISPPIQMVQYTANPHGTGAGSCKISAFKVSAERIVKEDFAPIIVSALRVIDREDWDYPAMPCSAIGKFSRIRRESILSLPSMLNS